LPAAVTFMCIVDGVTLYERGEVEEEALPALAGLLALMEDPAVEATVKVLFTSAPSPVVVKAAFKGEGEASMPTRRLVPRTRQEVYLYPYSTPLPLIRGFYHLC